MVKHLLALFCCNCCILRINMLILQVILMILAANAAVGVITETNAEKALEVCIEFDMEALMVLQVHVFI